MSVIFYKRRVLFLLGLSDVPVKEHLWLYGRLKGVSRRLVRHDINVLLAAAGLTHKADHLATSLSGGNVRKLSLLMALIGDRPLVLIDEFSSGVDSFSKREAWRTVCLVRVVIGWNDRRVADIDSLRSSPNGVRSCLRPIRWKKSRLSLVGSA